MNIAKRQKRIARKNAAQGKLNLVSLMDIFTILVFFLMINSGEVSNIKQVKGVQLPVSEADQPAAETVALAVTASNIVVGGRSIMTLKELEAVDNDISDQLKHELDYLASKQQAPAPAEGWPITIVADRQIPYETLKKIMATCVDSGYASISLAVEKSAVEEV